jgi:thioredoxin reductase (NADPH)
MADIKLYGAPWCPDCKRTKKFLAEQRVAYDWIDIEADEKPPRIQASGRPAPSETGVNDIHL